jgi:citrate synthase
MHPMTMLSMAILHLQNHSKFFQAYQRGISKSKHWEYYFEDAMDLIAKLPHICDLIYRQNYKKSQIIEPYKNLDWAGNFAHMLGYDNH